MTRPIAALPAALAVLASLVAGAECAAQAPADLVVRHASVFDPETLRVERDRLIEVSGGVIRRVVPDPGARGAPAARRVLDARGRLVTPGFIDVHHHTLFVLGTDVGEGGGAVASLSMRPDSIAAYRRRWARAYLPYGVTAVRELGGAEAHLPLMRAWMERAPWAPDFHPAGGALVSREAGRAPYPGHAEVRGPAAAAAKVRAYHARGLRHVKLYWRLREPDFAAALAEARRLDMNVAAHVDFGVMDVGRALRLGVRDFEHAYTLAVSVMTPDERAAAWNAARAATGGRQEALFHLGVLEHHRRLGPGDPRMRRLARDLAAARATVTPTLHLFAQRAGLAYFTTPAADPFEASHAWTAAQRRRARDGYRVLAGYVKALHDAGVPLAAGTDTREPGKALLSELLLLHQAGIPMPHVLRTATLNGARAIGREREYGRVAPGLRANLVVFDRSPLDDPRHLLGPRTVVKDGVVHPGASAP